ncbi:probable glycosyltransferase At5g03795 [Cucumis sativus]|uniref:Exostosin GT47 domain-containing protein n=1 Tax=Cucumis sativus TaxID=3659 RepID=A0A0A0KKQ6_CUCSA|nr:probable glycosyltransferase At5g03795 [Cucumis sativus]KGN50275.1 hypothetical protein Csa_000403 [Cucumis sativus]
MNKLLQRFSLYVMREVFRISISNKINWTKVCLIGAILTVGGIALQVLILPYPLHTWFVSRPATVILYESMEETMELNETHKNSTERVPLILLNSVVLQNATDQMVQLVSVNQERETSPKKRKSSRRRKHTKLKEKPIILTPPPPPRRPPSALERHVWSLKPVEALAYAKEELKHAPTVIDDADLYAPLFLNVSIFKRSYELMELILKVYIYRDGSRPIFHTPHLRGIYASEGWFMKLMEENRQFVTKDPEKAHLFYLAYSSRQLQTALYVPDSHNMKPLSIYLRDHVNWIAGKYPYWNRTHGYDHFLVACHDWGPYTVNEHRELSQHTIKALCNADLSEGVFKLGKDVSLPETTIRTPRKPLRNVGGKRVSQRPILAFFAGNMHGRVRPILLKHWNDKDDDIRVYGPLPLRVSRKMTYIQHMKSSKYCICPMGYEVNSPRIIEAIYYECVPVIIADNFVLPFSEFLDWSAFSVVVAEKDIPKLKEILTAIPLKRYLTMQINVKMVQKHFLWNPKPLKYDLFHMVLHSIWFSRLNLFPIPRT